MTPSEQPRMTASERLERLDGEMPHAPTHIATWPTFWEFRDALPELIAVVKAAELTDAETRSAGGHLVEHPALAAALTALERKLGSE